MKKILHVTAFVLCSMSALEAQMSYKDNHIFVGQKPAESSNMGYAPGIYIGPDFGIEYAEEGLNVWKPYPSLNWGNYKIFLDGAGRVGIGRKPTSYELEVNGRVWTTSGLLITSDGTKKKDVRNLSENRAEVVAKLKLLNGKSYGKEISSDRDNAAEVACMVTAGKIRPEDASTALQSLNAQRQPAYRTEFGFIAQEVRELFPELVEESEEGVCAVNYTGLIPVLLEAIKDLQDKVSQLEQKQSDNVLMDNSSNEAVDGESRLSQNIPNPFNGTTEIRYSLPVGAVRAAITVYSSSGTVVKTIPLAVNERQGSIVLSSSDLVQGTYIYTLTVNDIVFATKRMINQ